MYPVGIDRDIKLGQTYHCGWSEYRIWSNERPFSKKRPFLISALLSMKKFHKDHFSFFPMWTESPLRAFIWFAAFLHMLLRPPLRRYLVPTPSTKEGGGGGFDPTPYDLENVRLYKLIYIRYLSLCVNGFLVHHSFHLVYYLLFSWIFAVVWCLEIKFYKWLLDFICHDILHQHSRSCLPDLGA